MGVGVGVLSVLVILISYGCVAAAVLTGQLKGGPRPSGPVPLTDRWDPLHGSGLFMYMRPSSSRSLDGTSGVHSLRSGDPYGKSHHLQS